MGSRRENLQRLSVEDEVRIIDGYLAWDPRQQTSGQLAQHLGVAKQTMYVVLRRNGVPLKTKHAAATPKSFGDVLQDRIADRALRVLLERLYALTEENRRLRIEVEELR